MKHFKTPKILYEEKRSSIFKKQDDTFKEVRAFLGQELTKEEFKHMRKLNKTWR